MKMFYKLMFCCILSSLIVQVEVKAQKNNKIVYSDYGGYQADFLQVLKREGGVSSFTSMAVLKQHTKAVAENTVVPVHLRKAGEHMMEPTSMIEERKPSVLMVCKYIPATTQPDKVVFFASATVLSEDGVCLTNYHVLKSMIDEAVKLNRSDSILFVSTGPGKIYPISAILSYSKKGDMALFKIETGGDKLIPIPVGQDLAAGATVHTLTHPDEYLFFYSKGVVSRTISTGAADPFNNRTEISADYAKGSSGGPILDDAGNLIAMVSTTRSIYASEYTQSNLQMVVKQTIPVSSIRRLIK